MSTRGRTVAISAGIAVFAFTLGASLQGDLDKAQTPKSVPIPAPTVTVTASAAPQPAPSTPPQECVDYYLKAQELPAAVAAYEQNLGATKIAQNLAVQGVMRDSIKILNASRQALINLEATTNTALIDLHTLQAELEAGAKACQRASTP